MFGLGLGLGLGLRLGLVLGLRRDDAIGSSLYLYKSSHITTIIGR